MKQLDGLEIRTAEESLFGMWRSEEHHERFVPDGVVDEKQFGNSGMRIVYALKEPFDDPTKKDWGPWDLRTYLANGADDKWRWRVPARWALHLVGGDKAWEETIDKHSQGFRARWLSELAVVNIKKTGGHSRCNVGALYKYNNDCGKRYVSKQIALYSPSVVICGGRDVFNILKSYHLVTETGDEFYSDLWKCKVHSFYHYAASINHGLLHNQIINRIKRNA